MGFAAELKDFVQGFKTGREIRDRSRLSTAKWEKERLPNEGDLETQSDPFGGEGGAVPERIPQSTPAEGRREQYRRGISSIESGGPEGNYQAIGKVVNRQGDRALGRYQVMASNVGPWSRQVLGREVTTEEFLKNPAIQDQIFDTIFGGYVDKYGEKGAAQAWFGGPGAVGKGDRKDLHGTTVAGYGDRFIKFLGGEAAADAMVAEAAPASRGKSSEPGEEERVAAIPEDDEEPIEFGSRDVSFELPNAPQAPISDWTEFAQLSDQQLQGGPPSPPLDEEARPVVYAQRGGVIPEYAEGGVVDKYNPNRGYTQAIAPRSTSFGASRVRRPGEVPGVVRVDGLTPSQIALRDARARLAAQTPAPAPAPAAPNYTDDQRIQANIAYNRAAQRLGSAGTVDRDDGGWFNRQRVRNQIAGGWQDKYGGDEGRTAWLDQYLAADDKGRRKMTMPMMFEEGGMVPGVDPEYWEKAERKISSRDSGESARDRAAKRTNVRERGVTSSALRTGRRGEEVKGRSRERGRIARDKERLKSSTAAPVSPASVPTPSPRPERGADISRNPFDVQRGTGTQPLPGRMSDENAPAPARSERQVAEDRATRVPNVSDDPYKRDFRPISEAINWLMPNEAQAAPAVRPDDPSRPLPRPDPNQALPPQYPPNEPLPERFGPAIPEAPVEPSPLPRPDPSQAYRGAQPEQVRRPAPVSVEREGTGVLDTLTPYPDRVPQEPVEGGVWIQGRWVPMSDVMSGRAATSLGFAAGGVVPEEDEMQPRQAISPRVEEAAYTTSAPGTHQPQEPQYAEVRPTKRLRDDVARALDGGVRFLTQRFGLRGGGGALPMPEDGAMKQEGTRRFAMGEGAATGEEIRGIDDAVDPERRLNEGDRHMTRLAKTTQWYLERGRKDDAEASAAALMQYGAQRFGQLGAMAGAAYRKYEQTRDPQHLDNTVKFLEYAYRLIPDGGKMDVSINPQTGMLQATRLGPEGEEETYNLKPEELPAMIQTVQNSSAYWKQIFRLADPEGARSADIAKRDEARAVRTEERQAARDERLEAQRAARAEAQEERAISREDRAAQRALDREERMERREQRRFERANPQIDWQKIAPLRIQAEQAQKALAEADDEEAAQAAFNQAASRLFDELTGMTKDPGKALEGFGIMPEDYDYVAQAAGATPPAAADAPPAKYPNAKRGKDKQGNPIWVIEKDGKLFQVRE